MFCRLTYFCIQFIQRVTPPICTIHRTKSIWLSLLYKNCIKIVDCCPLKVFIKKRILKIEYQSVFSEFILSTSLLKKSTKGIISSSELTSKLPS